MEKNVKDWGQTDHITILAKPNHNPWPWPTTLNFNLQWAMVMTHTQAKYQEVEDELVQKLECKQTEVHDRLHYLSH